MRNITGYLLLLMVLVLANAAPALADTYFIYDQYGGSWSDANKTGNDDSLMCWAATAANILTYENWDTSQYNTSQAIFNNIVANWTNNVGDIYWAEEWWLKGTPPPFNSYSHIDVSGGGGYYPNVNFWNYFSAVSTGNLMASIDLALHQGKMVGLLVGDAGGGSHAVTVWGFNESSPGDYTDIYITDSDDGYYGLMEYPLIYQNGNWYLGGWYSGWYLSSIELMGAFSTPGVPSSDPLAGTNAAVPIAPTWVLFGTGLFSLLIFRGRHRWPDNQDS